MPMKLSLLALLFALGCATSQVSVPGPDAPADEAAAAGIDSVDEGAVRCTWEAMVTVLVVNKSTMDVQITFGAYSPVRAAQGLSRSTYRVTRDDLRSDIRLRILRGGLQTSAAPPIPTEHVVCNDALLIIGSKPRFSFFYGDVFLDPARGTEKGEGADTLSRSDH